MRLLNAKTLLLEEYFDCDVPPYAILSHRWRDGEVSLQDIQGPPPAHKAGYEKIRQTCLRALEDGLTHAWVDTCCIDKSSSTELSESINSMFRWYQMATVCYAYLGDVDLLPAKNDQASALANSVWFERGWTLQELLAPTRLVFYSSDWSLLGNREGFLDTIQQRTGIDREFLTFLDRAEGHHIHEASIAERMSWASSRRTTRIEDVAYCMLGILGISMPLLYGEGETAFIRLQEELIKHSDDQTILAWDIPPQIKMDKPGTSEAASKGHYEGILAKSPAAFAGRGNLIPRRGNYNATPFSVTNQGLTIEVPFYIDRPNRLYLLLLCGPKDDPTAMVALPLCEVRGNQYARGMAQPTYIGYDEWRCWRPRQVYLLVQPVSPARDRGFEDGGIWIRHIPDAFRFREPVPPGRWSYRHRIVDTSISRGILNATEPTPSFVLGLPGKEDGPPFIRVSLEAIFLPRSVARMLRITPFRASYTLIPTQSAENIAQSMDQAAVASRYISGASYIRLADGSLLYTKMSQQSILGKEFLIVDVKATRHLVSKASVLLQHHFLRIPLSFPMDLPTAKGWLKKVESVWTLMTMSLIFGWVLFTMVKIVAPESVYVAPILSWRNRVSSIVIQSFWSAYSFLTGAGQKLNYIMVAVNGILYPVAASDQLHMPRKFKLLLFGVWVGSVSVARWLPWSNWALWIRFAVWNFPHIYLANWSGIRQRVLPENQQHRQQDRMLTDSADSFIMGSFFLLIMIILFFLW